MDSNELLTITEVSALLRVRPAWIYARTCPQSAKDDRIPFLKFGRLLRFRRSEIEKWVEGQHSSAKPLGRQPDDTAQVAVSANLI